MDEDLASLIRIGRLRVGTTIFHRRRRYRDREVTATVVEGGLQVQVQGPLYKTPSAAARQITGKPVDGWIFWHLPDGERLGSLRPGAK